MEHLSLRTKVVLLLTVALALACLATGWIFVQRMRSSGERQVEQVREEALGQISMRLTEEVDIGVLDRRLRRAGQRERPRHRRRKRGVGVEHHIRLGEMTATIEAARAGEAGKGFAVVASEVKELAKQAAEATGVIRTRIESLLAETSGASQAIGAVAQEVDKVNALSQTIGAALEEQSATVKDIARNVSIVQERSMLVSRSTVQSAQGLEEIAKAIAELHATTREANSSTESLGQASGDLDRLASSLADKAKEFKI